MRTEVRPVGKYFRSSRLRYFVILMVLVVILVRVLSIGNPGVKDLKYQQFLAAVNNH